MAHDGFTGAFHHELPWPLAHASAAQFDALQVQVPHAFVSNGAVAGWEHDAAVSSLASSPASTAVGGGGAAGEAALMEQLASRLGVSVPSPSRYASCYSTPVGSPSKPVAPAMLAADAARLSCFAGSGGKLSRVASSQSLLGSPAPSPSPGGAGNLHGSDGSSSDGPSRKRKAPASGKSKAKDAVATATGKSPEAERRSKKSKLSADAGAEDDDDLTPAGGDGKGKEVVVAEAPKDYIHVRARRGQATDSHSLAERVRREKISERMKLLQDIVPGCSKVTGKAVMLDEIINYVQSLQRQVEFLSMKLSTVNPRLEVDVDSLVQKDANQPCVPAASSLPPPVYSLEGSSSAFCYASSPAVQSAVTTAKSFETPSSFVSHGIPDHSLQGFQNGNPQIGSLWEDDLQSLVQMGFRTNT